MNKSDSWSNGSNAMSLRLGFVGGGCNSAVGRAHLVSSQMDAKFRVVAGAFSRHSDVVTQTCDLWGVEPSRGYINAHEFLEKERGHIDAVAILTPTPNHTEYILAALEKSLPVICEKSMCSTVSDAKKIRDAIDKHKGFLRVTYTYSGYPMVREARRRITSGELGRIIRVQTEMPQEGFIKRNTEGGFITPQPWRRKDEVIPTISLDLGSHIHHLVGFLTDASPVKVVATQSSRGCLPGVIDDVACLVRYSGDFDCSMWFSKVALGNRNGLMFTVYCEKGSIEWRQWDPETLRIADSFGNVRTVDRGSPDSNSQLDQVYGRFKVGHPVGFVEAFGNIYFDFYSDLVQKQLDETRLLYRFYSADFADEGLKFLEALSLSAISNRWVDIG